MPKFLRFLLFVLVSSAAVVIPARPAPAIAIWDGACLINGNVTFSPPVGLTPTSTVVTVDVLGECVMNTGPEVIHLALTFDAPLTPMTCLAGASSGDGTFTILNEPRFVPRSGIAHLVNTGGVLNIVLVFDIFMLDGLLTLAPLPPATACGAGGGVGSGPYLGTLVFQDPDLSAESA